MIMKTLLENLDAIEGSKLVESGPVPYEDMLNILANYMYHSYMQGDMRVKHDVPSHFIRAIYGDRRQ